MGSQAILAFPRQTRWRYSDGNPLTGHRMQGRYEKFTIFDQYLVITQKGCEIGDRAIVTMEGE